MKRKRKPKKLSLNTATILKQIAAVITRSSSHSSLYKHVINKSLFKRQEMMRRHTTTKKDNYGKLLVIR